MSEVKTAVESAPVERDATAPVLLGRHHDISAFASSDPMRYAINSIHYNAAKRLIEATDGRMAIRVPVCTRAAEFPATKGGDAHLADVILPVAPFKKALGNVLAKRMKPVLQYARLSSNGDGKATFVTTDLDTEQAVTVKCIDGNYPPLDQVWPTKAPTLRIVLASGLLKRIAEYAERHGKNEESTGTRITFEFLPEPGPNEATDPVRFSFELADAMCEGPRAEGVLMPVRVQVSGEHECVEKRQG